MELKEVKYLTDDKSEVYIVVRYGDKLFKGCISEVKE